MNLKKPFPPLDAAEQQRYIAQVRAENENCYAAGGEPFYAFVETFGCQQNEADSEKLAGLCEAMGYAVTKDVRVADLIVVNTCAIR